MAFPGNTNAWLETHEDGDVAEWSDTSQFSASTLETYQGSYSGRHESASNSNGTNRSDTATQVGTPPDVALAMNIGSAYEGKQFIRDSGFNNVLALTYQTNSGFGEVRVNGITAETYDNAYNTWAVAEARDIDWSAKTCDLYYKGSLLKSGASLASTSAAEVYELRSYINSTGSYSIFNDAFAYQQAPPAVSDLAVGATRDTGIDLTWSATEGAEWYDILRAEATGSSKSDYRVVGTTSTTSFTDSPVETGEQYYYCVVAANDAGEAGLSNEVNTTTTVPAPSITSLDTTVENEITVNYSRADNSPDGGTEIYRSTDGTLGTRQATDGPDKALSFSGIGTAQYAEAPDGFGDPQKFTIEFAVRPDALDVDANNNYRRLVESPNAGNLVAIEESGAVSFRVPGVDTTIFTAGSLSTGAPVRVSCVYDQSDRIIYVDGTEVGRETIGTGTVDFGSYVRFGSSDSAQALLGALDDIRVWSVARTSSEINGDLDTELAGTETGLTAYYRADEERGSYLWDCAGDRHAEITNLGWEAPLVNTSGGSPWTDTGVVDGEKYHYTVRRATDHASADSTQSSAVTNLPAATGLSIDGYEFDKVQLSWTDNADNDDGYRVHYSTDGGTTWTQDSGDLPPNTESYTTNPLERGHTYTFKTTVFTEDGTTDSGTVSTDVLKTRRRASGAEGWHVEVDHPNGSVQVPILTGKPKYEPRLNDLPRIRIPVERGEKWQESVYDRATMHVYKDGEELPIDTLERVEVTPGGTSLVGRGGTALLQRASRNIVSKQAHLVAEDVIANETPYSANVDDPAATTSETVVQDADTNSEFTNVAGLAATTPLAAQDGALTLLQSCFNRDGAAVGNGTNGAYTEFTGNASNDASDTVGAATGLSSVGDYVEWTFTTEYEVPDGSDGVFIRVGNDDSNSPIADGPELKAFINGAAEPLTAAGFSLNNDWAYIRQESGRLAGLPPGTYTLRIEVTTAGSETAYIDRFGFYDQRFSYSWDNTVDANYNLLGPQLYPNSVAEKFNVVQTSQQVAGARVSSTWNDVSGSQELAVTNDGGTSWTTAANTDTLDTTFSSSGSSVQFRGTFSRWGSGQNETPTAGYKGQQMSVYSLYADLEDSPTITDTRYDDSVLGILQDLADFGDFLFEYRLANGKGAVEFTKPGLRTAELDASVVQYEVRQDSTDSYQKIGIEGGARPVTGESFTSNYDTAVALNGDRLVESAERVYDGSTEYVRGTDYEMDYQAGEITVLSSGSMADATSYSIDYRHKAYGSFAREDYDASTDRQAVKSIPEISTDLGCEAAARYLVRRVGTPVTTATATIDKTGAGLSLVDDVALPDVPTAGEKLEIRSLEQTPSQVVLSLGLGQGLADAMADLQTRLRGTATRV